MKLNGQLFHGVSVSFDFVAPPQIDEERAFALARLHLTGLFFLLGFNRETREGPWWPHGFHPVMIARRSNWGSSILRGSLAATGTWDCRFHGVSADGFFKAVIRRHPSRACWAWALEWNHSHRLIGFFGEREPAQDIVDALPMRQVHSIHEGPRRSLHYSVDTPLDEADDTLFQLPPEHPSAADDIKPSV